MLEEFLKKFIGAVPGYAKAVGAVLRSPVQEVHSRAGNEGAFPDALAIFAISLLLVTTLDSVVSEDGGLKAEAFAYNMIVPFVIISAKALLTIVVWKVLREPLSFNTAVNAFLYIFAAIIPIVFFAKHMGLALAAFGSSEIYNELKGFFSACDPLAFLKGSLRRGQESAALDLRVPRPTMLLFLTYGILGGGISVVYEYAAYWSMTGDAITYRKKMVLATLSLVTVGVVSSIFETFLHYSLRLSHCTAVTATA